MSICGTITTSYLRGDCKAIQYEYGFAMEHHIPILPIMMKPGLENCFTRCLNRINEGYGNLQFLDHTSNDSSEIPYEEKLEKRLSSILISDKII